MIVILRDFCLSCSLRFRPVGHVHGFFIRGTLLSSLLSHRTLSVSSDSCFLHQRTYRADCARRSFRSGTVRSSSQKLLLSSRGQTQTNTDVSGESDGSQVTGLCVMNNQRRSCEGEHRLRKLSDSSSGYRCVCVRVNSHQRVLCDEMCDDRKGVCR